MTRSWWRREALTSCARFGQIFAELPHLDLLDLDDAGLEPRPDEEDAIEAFDTFEENALAKARYFARAIRAAGSRR